MSAKEESGNLWDVVRRLCLWSGVLGGFVALMSLVVLPLVADAAVKWLPRSFEKNYSRQVEQALIQNLAASGKMPNGARVCQAPGGILALNKIFRQFQNAIPDEARISVTVMDADVANAMALPGVRMLIFSKLFELTDHPNAFAGVIAHELGHLAARHPLRSLVERSYGAMLLSLLVGERMTGAMQSGVSPHVLSAANSRALEQEADEAALAFMKSAGLDSTALAGFHANMHQTYGQAEDLPALFQTHPPSRERIDFILNAPKTGDGLALTDTEWQALRRICSVTTPYGVQG